MSDPNAAKAPPDLALMLRNERQTGEVAARLAPCLAPGWVVHLSGPLGAGKTAFCRALLRSLGYNGRVRSPSFTLLEPYNLSAYTIYHFDFYRFSSQNELRDAGFEECLDGAAVVLVEWPEMAAGALPDPDLLLRLEPADDDDARRLQVFAGSERGRACLSGLASPAPASGAPGSARRLAG